MKKKLTALTELQASFILAGLISIILLIVSFIFLFLNQPGWIIGVTIGTGVEFLYIWLVNFGSSLTLKEGKTGLFFLTYGLRIFSFIGFFALLVVLQYVVKVEAFFYSCWGMLIAFAPATFITIATQLMHKEEK